MLGRIITEIKGILLNKPENMAIAIKPEQIRPTEKARKALSGEVLIEHDMLDLLSGMIESKRTKKAVAVHLGISVPFLMDVLIGRRPISEGLARKMGWEKLTVFVKR
jgi:hypothetical protein